MTRKVEVFRFSKKRTQTIAELTRIGPAKLVELLFIARQLAELWFITHEQGYSHWRITPVE